MANGYDWGDPKNPEYVEWLLDQIDHRRKEVQLNESAPQRQELE